MELISSSQRCRFSFSPCSCFGYMMRIYVFCRSTRSLSEQSSDNEKPRSLKQTAVCRCAIFQRPSASPCLKSDIFFDYCPSTINLHVIERGTRDGGVHTGCLP